MPVTPAHGTNPVHGAVIDSGTRGHNNQPTLTPSRRPAAKTDRHLPGTQIVASSTQDTYECDALVVGSGCAGMSAAVAQSNQAPATQTQFNHRQPTQAPRTRPSVFYSHYQSTQAPPTREAAVSSAGGTGFNWGDAGIGAGLAAGLVLLLLLGAMRLRTSRRGVLTT